MSCVAVPQQGRSSAAELPPFIIPFPDGRSVLRVREVAGLLLVSGEHVSNLIEEGKLQAMDISGGPDSFAVFVSHLTKLLKVPHAAVEKAFLRARREVKRNRSFSKSTIAA